MAANLIDRPDEWLRPLQKAHPLIGWTITIVLIPPALLLGILGLVLALVAVPFMGLGGLVLLGLAFTKLIFKEQFKQHSLIAALMTMFAVAVMSTLLYYMLGGTLTTVALGFAITGMLGFLHKLEQ